MHLERMNAREEKGHEGRGGRGGGGNQKRGVKCGKRNREHLGHLKAFIQP